MNDRDLLQSYVEERSDDAFRALVDRYIQMIYSACWRQLRDRHLAEDATQGVFVVLLITQLKTAAVVVMVCLTLAGSGWIASRALAQKAEAPVAVTPARVVEASAPTAAAMAPATKPVVDLSTPEKALDSFCKAMETEDRVAVYACLTADPNRPPLMIDRLLRVHLAQNRLVHTAGAAFGSGERVRWTMTFDQAGRMVQASMALGAGALDINGNTARMTVQFADFLLRTLPADDAAALRIWNGKGLQFTRDGDQWKLDLDRSMRVDATLSNQKMWTKDPKLVGDAVDDLTRIMEELAASIVNDQITGADQLQMAMNIRINQALQKYNRATGITLDVLPVEEPTTKP